ncbi:MAG: serine/threonine-protein kinase [Myxococcota bacterium]
MSGEVLDGKYVLDERIGRGGMGEVFAGRNLVTGKRVAIKRLLSLPDLAEEIEARFLREARAASRLEHANVVEVFDVGRSDGSLFMVMELLRGESLQDRLDRDQRLTVQEATQVLVPVLRAIQHAHERDVIHRDLKPDNIWLSEIEGADEVIPKVLDFGIAKFAHDPEVLKLTRSGVTMGTPYYMSPEQTRDSAEIDGRADIYSLGVILYETLSGRRPYEASSYPALVMSIVTGDCPYLGDLVPELREEVNEVVHRAMAKQADERFSTAKDFAAALAAVADDHPTYALRPRENSDAAIGLADTVASEPELEANPRKRRWGLVIAGIAVAAAAAVAFSIGGEPDPVANASTEAASTEAGSPEASNEADLSTEPQTSDQSRIAEATGVDDASDEEPDPPEGQAAPPLSTVRVETGRVRGAKIYVDGEERCQAPCELELEPVATTVGARRAGFHEASIDLTPPFPSEPVVLTLRRARPIPPSETSSMMEGLPFMDR